LSRVDFNNLFSGLPQSHSAQAKVIRPSQKCHSRTERKGGEVETNAGATQMCRKMDNRFPPFTSFWCVHKSWLPCASGRRIYSTWCYEQVQSVLLYFTTKSPLSTVFRRMCPLAKYGYADHKPPKSASPPISSSSG
jgi:hypothetical protein